MKQIKNRVIDLRLVNWRKLEWLKPEGYKISSANSSTDFHKAAFPVKLVLEVLELMTMPNDIVADIFLGTGTTIIGANLIDRTGYGIEMDPIYIDLILKRYKKLYPKSQFECVNRKFDFKKLFLD